jgi:multiple sugar transport system ATP-binding protein
MAFPLKLRGTPEEEQRRKVEEVAEVLDLTQHLDRRPANLSGGQRQRVAMGRAIVRDPAAYLMDEPLSNLDAKLRVQMRTEVSRLQKRLGTTTIYVTHDQTEAMTLGDRVAVMRAGVLQQVAPPMELYNKPENLFVAGFIGSPAMNFMTATLEGGELKLPIASVRFERALRDGAQPSGQLIAGIRPESFEDAAVVSSDVRDRGCTFRAHIEVLESMGSELYAHFTVAGASVDSAELRELAADAGAGDLPSSGGEGEGQITARLSPESRVAEGQEAEIWLDLTGIHLFDPQSGARLTE